MHLIVSLQQFVFHYHHLVFLWQLCICGFAIATGAASRLISGYDSYGNTCGQKNAKIPEIELSGLDHSSRKCVKISTE